MRNNSNINNIQAGLYSEINTYMLKRSILLDNEQFKEDAKFTSQQDEVHIGQAQQEQFFSKEESSQ